MKTSLTLTALAAAALLAGCATSTQERVKTDRGDADVRIAAEQSAFRKQLDEANARRVAAQVVDRPFIAGGVKPLARGVAMPEQLRRSVPVTALFSAGGADLETALRQISQASGLLLTATPDALLSPSAFGPKLAGAASPVGAPPRVVLQVQNQPLWQLLDDVARQTQTTWRPVASGAEFYRVETRTFPLSVVAQSADTNAALGRNGGSNQVFESQSKTSFSSKDLNPAAGILKAVDAMLSAGGKVTLSAESGTLVVTDTPAALARVEKFLDEQNKLLSRRVRMVLDVVEVADKDQSDVGLDWSLLYTKASGALTMATPGSLVSAQAGSFGINQTTGQFAGSTLAVKALSEVGVVVNRRSFPLLTTSRRPVTQAIRSTFNYVDQVQAVSQASSSTTVQAPTVTQKDETVGTFVTVMPTAQVDGSIILSLSFDQTSAQPLVPFTVGSSSSSVTVQQKTIDGTGIIQEIPMRSGQSVVVGGIESATSQDTIRRLLPGAPILTGGSNSSKLVKTRMVLIVTAVIEEGA